MELTLDEIKFLVRYEYVLGRTQVSVNNVHFNQLSFSGPSEEQRLESGGKGVHYGPVDQQLVQEIQSRWREGGRRRTGRDEDCC